MDVYCTSKNSNPSLFGLDPTVVVYIGTSLEEAIASVGTVIRYEKPIDKSYIPSALPRRVEPKPVRFYTDNGWWYSIVKIQLFEQE